MISMEGLDQVWVECMQYVCHQYNTSKGGDETGRWIRLTSMSSIMRFATTTFTADPIVVPCTSWYTFPLNDKKTI